MLHGILTNELNHLFTTYNKKVVNRWDGGETARGCSRKLSLGLDLRFDLGLGLRQDLGLGLRQDLGLGLRLDLGLGLRQDLGLGLNLDIRLGLTRDIGEWQAPRRSKHTRRAARGWKPRED